MVGFKNMVRQATELHSQANQKSEPKIRHRLHRMADISHIAETDREGRRRPPGHDLPEPPGVD
jgi:hypothetical protein